MTIYYVKYSRTDSVVYVDDTVDESFVDMQGVVRPVDYLKSPDFLKDATVMPCAFSGGEMKSDALYDNVIVYNEDVYRIDSKQREFDDAMSRVLSFLEGIKGAYGESVLLATIKNSIVEASTVSELEQIYSGLVQ